MRSDDRGISPGQKFTVEAKETREGESESMSSITSRKAKRKARRREKERLAALPSSNLIALFKESKPSGRDANSIALSILLHGTAIGALSLGIAYAPQINEPPLTLPYFDRLLAWDSTDPQIKPADRGIGDPVLQSLMQALATGGKEASVAAALRQVVQQTPAPQTLVQPDLPANLVLAQKIPLPLMVMRSSNGIPSEIVVPPAPQWTSADVRPSLNPPNRELNPADIPITATTFAIDTVPILPSTTSPVSVRKPAVEEKAPETASNSPQKPSPASVTSVPELRRPDRTVLLPHANEIRPADSFGNTTLGQLEGAAHAGNGTKAGQGHGTNSGSGQGQSTGPAQAANIAHAQGTNTTGHAQSSTTGSAQGATNAPGQGLDAGFGAGSEPAATRITLAKNGQFGVVVVGSSIEEIYPETAGLWSGRLAYTVYLHMGTSKSWILQYSVPHTSEAPGTGSVTQPEAPWPYDIVRPNLAPGVISADALMIHGFVNKEGRFENLALVFPTQFALTKLVLNSLQQWKFRPASQNGQVAAVEVLLIIPDEQE